MDKKEAKASYRRMENWRRWIKCQTERDYVRIANLMLQNIVILAAKAACADDR